MKLKIIIAIIFILIIILIGFILINFSDNKIETEKVIKNNNLIEIIAAEYLSPEKEFIENVYFHLKEKDDFWFSFSNEHYLRVTFERSLTSRNDITVYARGAGKIEVYLPETEELITEFTINGEEFYQQYLNNMVSQSAVFELKFLGNIELDYIVDPSLIGNLALSASLTQTEGSSGGMCYETSGLQSIKDQDISTYHGICGYNDSTLLYQWNKLNKVESVRIRWESFGGSTPQDYWFEYYDNDLEEWLAPIEWDTSGGTTHQTTDTWHEFVLNQPLYTNQVRLRKAGTGDWGNGIGIQEFEVIGDEAPSSVEEGNIAPLAVLTHPEGGSDGQNDDLEATRDQDLDTYYGLNSSFNILLYNWAEVYWIDKIKIRWEHGPPEDYWFEYYDNDLEEWLAPTEWDTSGGTTHQGIDSWQEFVLNLPLEIDQIRLVKSAASSGSGIQELEIFKYDGPFTEEMGNLSPSAIINQTEGHSGGYCYGASSNLETLKDHNLITFYGVCGGSNFTILQSWKSAEQIVESVRIRWESLTSATPENYWFEYYDYDLEAWVAPTEWDTSGGTTHQEFYTWHEFILNEPIKTDQVRLRRIYSDGWGAMGIQEFEVLGIGFIDEVPPEINISFPSPEDGAKHSLSDVSISVLASDIDTGKGLISSFIDFNNSLISWYRFETYQELVLNGGAETGTTDNWNNFTGVTDTDSYEGDYSFYGNSYLLVSTDYLIPVESNSTYNLSGWFKSTGNDNSRLYFGFIPYDKDGQRIFNHEINAIVNTETTLYETVYSHNKTAKIVDGSNWYTLSHGRMAFNIDSSGNYEDLPNRSVSNSNIIRVENMGDYWEIEFNTSVGFTATQGTEVRMHQSGGTYLYTAAGNAVVPDTWTEYTGTIQGESLYGTVSGQWWPKTEYVNVFMFLNYNQNSDYTLLVDNISLTGPDFFDEMNRNNLTEHGSVEIVEGFLGKAAYFFNSYLNFNTTDGIPLGNSPRTYSVWINTPSWAWSNPEYILGIYPGSGWGNGNWFMLNWERRAFSLTMGGHRISTPQNTLTVNTWYHFVARVPEGSTTTNHPELFINGVKQNLTNIACSDCPHTLNTVIDSEASPNPGLHTMGGHPSIGNKFRGDIDDIIIFDRALSDEEIQALYANSFSKYFEGNYTNLLEGEHTFKVYSQDRSGNVASTEKVTFEIDSISPLISFEDPTPEEGSSSTDYNITARVFASDEDRGDNRVATFIELGDSLISWLRMEEIDGDTVIDYMNKNHGTNVGAQRTTLGYFGKALDFRKDEEELLMDYRIWEDGQTASVGSFSRIGQDSENYRIMSEDPWGREVVVWEARPDDVSGADGGWNHNINPIDNTKLYRFSVWVNRRVMGTDGRFYLGTAGYGDPNGVIILSNGNVSTNPYFWVSSNPPNSGLIEDEWILVVGHVFPYDHTGTSRHSDSGRYLIDGTKVGDTTSDFKWLPETTYGRHRSYLYYATDTSVRQQWVYPRVDVIDGTEPSLEDLLNGYDNYGDDIEIELDQEKKTISFWYREGTSTFWNHVVNSNGAYYYNGNKASWPWFTYPVYLSGNKIHIGRTSTSRFFKGTIDDVMIFNRELTNQEVLGLYANSSSKYLQKDYSYLEEGEHTLIAYVQDEAGNLDLIERTFEVIHYPSIVRTYAAASVDTVSAVLRGRVINTGGPENISVYFQWGTSSGVYDFNNRDTAEIKTGLGLFSKEISDLDPDTIYYFRAITETEKGISYGEEKIFLTTDKITINLDIDGRRRIIEINQEGKIDVINPEKR